MKADSVAAAGAVRGAWTGAVGAGAGAACVTEACAPEPRNAEDGASP